MKMDPEDDKNEILIRNQALWTKVTKGISNGCMGTSISEASLAVMGLYCKQSAFFIVHYISGEPFHRQGRPSVDLSRSLHRL